MSPEAYWTLFLLITATAVSTLVASMIIRSIFARRKEKQEEQRQIKDQVFGSFLLGDKGIRESHHSLEHRVECLDKRVKDLEVRHDSLRKLVKDIDDWQDKETETLAETLDDVSLLTDRLDALCIAVYETKPTTKKATK